MEPIQHGSTEHLARLSNPASQTGGWDGPGRAYVVRLHQCAPQASSLAKDLVRLSWEALYGWSKQDAGRKRVFDAMMSVDSESAYGLAQFQAGNKECDW